MKRNLTESQATDAPAQGLTALLDVPGLNTHLLSFVDTPDLCRLKQCSKSVKQAVQDLKLNWDLERDVSILRECGTDSERIAKFREMYPLLAQRKARIVAYLQFDYCDLSEHKHNSVAQWLRDYIEKQADLMEVTGINSESDSKVSESVLQCHFCEKKETTQLISTESSGFSFIVCLGCLKQRDSLMLRLNKQKWNLMMDGRYDDGLEDMEDALDHFEQEFKWTHRRMTRRDGTWLMRVGNGCDNDQDWGALRIEFTKERPKK